MAKFSRPTIQPLVKPSDIKKAIAEKNKKLEAHNKNLEGNIKKLVDEEAAIKKETTAAKRQKTKALKELEAEAKTLDSLKDKVKKAKEKVEIHNIEASKLMGSANNANEALELANERMKAVQNSMIGYNKILSNQSDIEKSVKDMTLQFKDTKKKVSSLKATKTKCEGHIKNYEDLIDKKGKEFIVSSKKLDDLKQEHSAELDIMKIESTKILFARAKDLSNLESKIIDKNLVMDEIRLLTSKAEKKLKTINNDAEKQKKAVKDAKDEVKTIQENFEQWKINNLDEMARMKLRGRMENIDKAGLKDVLSR